MQLQREDGVACREPGRRERAESVEPAESRRSAKKAEPSI
jgi:hypothetical protein